MSNLTMFETVSGCIIFALAMLFIILLIGAGFKVAADAAIEEAEKSVERRAERRAHEIVKERLDGVQIRVTQRISVIEDDLKGGRT